MASSLDETHLGCRVSVLFRIFDDPEHPYSEAVGVLQRIDRKEAGTSFLILRRDGESLDIDEGSIVSLKLLG